MSMEPNDYNRQHLEDFRNRLDWFMADDNPLKPHPDRALIEAELNADAQAISFDDWVDAWHRFSPRETEMDRLMRCAFEITPAPRKHPTVTDAIETREWKP